MARFPVNRKVDTTVEFKGLKAQYLTYLVMGLMFVFLLSTIMALFGISSYAIAFTAIVLTTAVFMVVYKMNYKYGQFGLMKISARRSRPKFIIVRKGVRSILNVKRTRLTE